MPNEFDESYGKVDVPYFFNETWNYQAFLLYAADTKFNKMQARLLPPFPRVLKKKRDVEELVNQFIDFFNYVVKPTADLAPHTQMYKDTKKFVERLAVHPEYMENPSYINGVLMTYADMLDIPQSEKGELRDLFRYMVYLPVMKLHVKKQKIMVGVHSETGKPLFERLKIVFPGPETLRQAKYGHLNDLDYTELKMALSNYFIFPLSLMCRLFNENDLDLLPEYWGHTIFHKLRHIPDIGGNWLHYIEEGLKNRAYVLPREGVLIDCLDFGDLKSITFKEVNLDDEGTIVCYAKVSFSDGMDDIVIFNPVAGIPLASGSGDIYGFDEDPVLRIVAKAYRDLISARRIAHKSPTSKLEHQERIVNHSKKRDPAFMYIPRVYYAGKRTSAIRQRADKELVKRRPHTVVGHLRRGQATEAQKAEALKYGLELPEGYTWVRPHKRGGDKESTLSKARMKR